MANIVTWIIALLILALLAVILGAWGIAIISIDIAKWLIILFIILVIILVLLGRGRRWV